MNDRIVRGMYGDIIDMPYDGVKRHAKMSAEKRAAQFLPFAALTGFDDAINETARFVDEFHAPDEEESQRINNALRYLACHVKEHPQVTLCHFVKDPNKPGGKYETSTFILRGIDLQSGWLIDMDRVKYPLSSIVKIRCAMNEESDEIGS